MTINHRIRPPSHVNCYWRTIQRFILWRKRHIILLDHLFTWSQQANNDKHDYLTPSSITFTRRLHLVNLSRSQNILVWDLQILRWGYHLCVINIPSLLQFNTVNSKKSILLITFLSTLDTVQVFYFWPSISIPTEIPAFLRIQSKSTQWVSTDLCIMCGEYDCN